MPKQINRDPIKWWGRVLDYWADSCALVKCLLKKSTWNMAALYPKLFYRTAFFFFLAMWLCRISVCNQGPGIEPEPQQRKAQNPNPSATKELPTLIFQLLDSVSAERFAQMENSAHYGHSNLAEHPVKTGPFHSYPQASGTGKKAFLGEEPEA